MSTASKTLAIKARVYNQIRTDLYCKLKEGKSFNNWKGKNYEFLTDKDKLELFNKWFDLNKEAHTELNNYKEKRKTKKAVDAYRKTSGYYEKKAAKKAKAKEYQKTDQQLAHAI